jgi:predicted RNA-binding protein with TRAM domain
MGNIRYMTLKCTLLILVLFLAVVFSGCLLVPGDSSEVIFETDPAEVEISINGEPHSSPSRIVVRAGSELLVEVMQIETIESASLPGNDTRYVFDRWDDGDTTNPRHVVVDGDKKYKALMAKEYRLEVATNIGAPIEGSGWYREGVTISLEAPQVEGYEFIHWEVNGEICGDHQETTLSCDSPRSVLASYREKEPSLLIGSTPLKTVQVSVDGENLQTPVTITRKFNERVIVEVSPIIERDTSEFLYGIDTRYLFEEWEGIAGSENPLEFRIRNDISLVARYGTNYKVEVSSSPTVATIDGSGWYEGGSSVTFTAPSVNGYNFLNWKVNDENKDSSSTLSVDMSTPLKVIAIYNTHPTMEIPDQEVEKGETLSLSLLNWSNDPDGDTLTFTLVSGPGNVSGSTYSLDTSAVEAGQHEVKIKADDGRGGTTSSKFTVFVEETTPDTVKLTVSTAPETSLDVKIDGSTYTSAKSITVEHGTSQTIEAISPQEKNMSSHVSGNDTRYSFIKWNDGNTSKSRTVTVTDDVTYTAQMKIEYKVEVSSSPTVATIDVSGWYEGGSSVTFTAPSVNGYNFLNWKVNDQGKGSNTNLSIDIETPLKVVAIYNTHPGMEIPDQEVEKGETLTLSLLNWSNDPDGDTLTFTLVSGPGNVSGSTYSLDTSAVEAGQHEVKIKADDGRGGEVQTDFLVEVALVNRPPEKPSNPSPSDGASGIGLNVTLSWTCNDADGDPLTYDVYVGTSSNPPKVASSISESCHQVGSLEPGKKYYWRVVARDPDGASTSSNTWQFTTANGNLDFSGPVYYGDMLLVSNESLNSGSTQHTGTLSEDYLQQASAATPRGLPLEAYAINPFIPEPDYVDNSMLAYRDAYEIQAMEPLSIGNTRQFWVYDFRTNSRYQITATLQYVGSKSEIWAEDTSVITQSRAAQLGQEFDDVIYPLVTTYFYTPSDVSGNGRVAILCFDIQDNFENTGAFVAGYFDAGDLYNTTHSNRMEIFYIDTYPLMHHPRSNPPDVTRAFSTLVHEFQHMVNHNRNRIVEGGANMPTWLNEGMSMAAEHIYGGVLTRRISYYNFSNSVRDGHSILRWGDNGDVLANYALSYLFLQYIREQCSQGDFIFREMLLDSSNDYRAVENVIRKYVCPDMTFGEFMTSFRLALLLKESSGFYGFMGNSDFRNVSTRVYAGNGKTLYGGSALFKSINDSFTDPGNGGSSIQYVGIYN